MQRYSLVVFDWDGTLMDSTPSIAAGIQAACRELDLPVPDDNVASWVIGLSLDEALPHIVPTLQQEQVPAFIKAFRRYFVTQEEKIRLFPGVVPMLERLKSMGVLLAIATGKPRRGLELALQETQIGHFFDYSRCADESFSKPHPGMLLEIMDELLVPPEQTVMIGDTSHDLLMAKNARTAGLAVSYGAHRRLELATHEPIEIVNSVFELEQCLAPRVKAWVL